MTAWVLIIGLGLPYSVTIDRIYSQAECERLAKEINLWSLVGHRCIKYQTVP